ncbi:MAG: hypothetical protein QGG54_04220 [Gammaproteobacteria bacterium]|nr:hypothetical protein [Gammaproteobacteria bacterium]
MKLKPSEGKLFFQPSMTSGTAFWTRLALLIWLSLFASCSQPFTVTVNDQAVYDPTGRLIGSEVSDADLQGCINLALQQQNVRNAEVLMVLSCANSEIQNLERIGQLVQLRFLDLANNNISNLTPLEELPLLGGLNLSNNLISNVGPLFNIPNLASVSLVGNNDIACDQLQLLHAKFGDNLTPPESCRD